MYQVYGFGFVRELELMQEAGFNPLEALRAATLSGAELLGVDDEVGTLEVGKRADILIYNANPLEDFKLLYGSGTIRLDDATNKTFWTHCLQTTIRNGILYDTAQLLADVERMVAAARTEDATP